MKNLWRSRVPSGSTQRSPVSLSRRHGIVLLEFASHPAPLPSQKSCPYKSSIRMRLISAMVTKKRRHLRSGYDATQNSSMQIRITYQDNTDIQIWVLWSPWGSRTLWIRQVRHTCPQQHLKVPPRHLHGFTESHAETARKTQRGSSSVERHQWIKSNRKHKYKSSPPRRRRKIVIVALFEVRMRVLH